MGPRRLHGPNSRAACACGLLSSWISKARYSLSCNSLIDSLSLSFCTICLSIWQCFLNLNRIVLSLDHLLPSLPHLSSPPIQRTRWRLNLVSCNSWAFLWTWWYQWCSPISRVKSPYVVMELPFSLRIPGFEALQISKLDAWEIWIN